MQNLQAWLFLLPILVYHQQRMTKKSLSLPCQYIPREGQRAGGPSTVKRFELAFAKKKCYIRTAYYYFYIIIEVVVRILNLLYVGGEVLVNADAGSMKGWFCCSRRWVVVNVVKTACGENAHDSLRWYDHTMTGIHRKHRLYVLVAGSDCDHIQLHFQVHKLAALLMNEV